MNVTDIQMFKTRTGSLVSGGLLTCRPNTSSWNWSSWTTRLDRDLLVGGSAWMYCAQTHENKLNCAAGCLYQISQREEISVKTATRIGKWGGDGVTNIANLSFLSLFTKSVFFFIRLLCLNTSAALSVIQHRTLLQSARRATEPTSGSELPHR